MTLTEINNVLYLVACYVDFTDLSSQKRKISQNFVNLYQILLNLYHCLCYCFNSKIYTNGQPWLV
uniref:Uncharacterized protein n=1 Tax=Arundo donax TaxID=35708 RepID=A0A0A8YVG0_ARUDO